LLALAAVSTCGDTLPTAVVGVADLVEVGKSVRSDRRAARSGRRTARSDRRV